MKISSLLFLAIPLASAALDVRQSPEVPEVSCSNLCGITALADSSKEPRCQLTDTACLCADEGWANSYAKCVADICPANAVAVLYKTWSDQCNTIGVPLKSEPSYTGTGSAPTPMPSQPGMPGPDPSASALPSVVSAAKSILAGQNDTQLASVSSALNNINATATASTTEGAGSSSASPSAAPISAGSMLLPPAGLLAGLLAVVFAF